MRNSNKYICALAYLVFFIPLIVEKDNVDYRFHAGQGLNLLVATCIIVTVGLFVPIIGWFIVLPTGSLYLFFLWITGIVNTLNSKNRELPFIGKWRLIKS